MKKMRLVALLLALFMLVAVFAACKDEVPADISASEAPDNSEVSDVSEVSQVPERIDGTETYEKAAELLENSKDFKIASEYELSVTVGTEIRTESGRSEETYHSYGEKDMAYYAETETKYGETRTVKSEETFIDGTAFLLYDGKGFYSAAESDYELFLLDTELYGEITELYEKDEDGNTVITFSQAESVEEWLAYEYAVLEDASAEVIIDPEGNIVSLEYTAKYEQGAAYNEITYSFTVTPAASLPEITVPEDIKNYLKVDSVSAVVLMDEALMYLQNIGTYSYESVSFMHAAGTTIQSSHSSYTVFEYGDDFASDFSMTKQSVWYDFDRQKEREDSVENETTIIDGKMTGIINGKETEKDLSREEIEENNNVHRKSLMFCVPDISDINEIAISAIDGYITMTVQCNKSHGEAVYDNISDLLNEFDYIEDISDDYDTEKTEFVITVDMDTHYPVALSIDYEGMFTIEGDEYEMTLENTVSINPANPDFYYDITEKHHPDFDKEPIEEEKATPLFYKVTDANGNVMWLLGTIHVGDNRTAYLPDEIYDAFDSSDAAAFEIDVIALNEAFEEGDEDLIDLYYEAYYYDDDTTIDDKIDETLYRDAKELMIALGLGGYGDYIAEFDHGKPNMWSSIIGNKYIYHSLGVYYNKGVDMRLLERAKSADKTVYEIEDSYRQFEMDIEFSDDVHELNLYNAVYYSRSYSRADMIAMYEAWCAGDIDELDELVNAEADFTGMSDDEIAAYEEYNKVLQDDRDALMLEKAEEYIASGETVFYAVGLAHLLDEDTGLVNTLEEAGYTVELVEYK